jgi:hypothetical protein
MIAARTKLSGKAPVTAWQTDASIAFPEWHTLIGA